MKKRMTRMFCLMLSAAMIAGSSMAVFADEDGEVKAEVQVEENDKPYVSFGEDLTAQQKQKVIDLMGLDPDEEDEWDISYVTNEEEHQYLDSYISSSQIGSKALSSVVILQREDGNGINVTTKNINYCTEGMYQNALATAGMEDADVIVAGPFEISGTAALVGALKAYSEMTGEEVSEESLDTALNELVITGEIADSTGDTDEIEGMVAYLKKEVAENDLDDEEEISSIIDEAASEFGVSLTDEEKQKLISLLKKIANLDLDVDSLVSQAKSIYNKLADMGIDLKDEEVQKDVGNIFTKLIQMIKDFFAKYMN